MRKPARSVTKAKAPTFAAVVNRPMGALDHNLNRRAGKAPPQPPFPFISPCRPRAATRVVVARSPRSSRLASFVRSAGALLPAVTRGYAAYATATAWCGTLAGCAESAALPSTQQPSHAQAKPQERAENGDFAPVTLSPRTAAAALDDPGERQLAEACGEADGALVAVAKQLAERQSTLESELEIDAISYALRAAGSPYVWPRAWLFNGSEGEIDAAKGRMQRWLRSFSDGG